MEGQISLWGEVKTEQEAQRGSRLGAASALSGIVQSQHPFVTKQQEVGLLQFSDGLRETRGKFTSSGPFPGKMKSALVGSWVRAYFMVNPGPWPWGST